MVVQLDKFTKRVIWMRMRWTLNAYRGKIFVEIDGKRYYVCSFKK